MTSNFLESDASFLHSKLQILNKPENNELQSNIMEAAKSEQPKPYKIIKPDPGFCVKAYRKTDNKKYFINICMSDSIPAPEEISASKLIEILSSDSVSNYKIPMSISELRITKDKSGKEAIAFDVAINPTFYNKVQVLEIFRDFLITIIFEALETKHNIQINRETWIILKNRKSMGILVRHRIQNRDVQKVYESYQNPTKEHKAILNELKYNTIGKTSPTKRLITEIESSQTLDKIQAKHPLKSSTVNSLQTNAPQTVKPDFRLFKLSTNNSTFIIVEFFLPKIFNSNEISLHLGRDRIMLQVRRIDYEFDSFFPFDVDVSLASSEFDGENHILTVKIPILAQSKSSSTTT